MANRAARLLRAVDLLSPVGCHYYRNQARDQWEVTLFASSTEVIGGRYDGRITASKFCLDLRELLGLFDDVTGFQWQALPLGPEDELGPHISLEGRYEGRSVWLRILATAPPRFETGRCLNARDLRLDDVW
jgi:hypothetical protein